MSVRVSYRGKDYLFARDTYGVGYWYATTGRSANITVPILVATELRKQAAKQGISPEMFTPRKVEKEKSIRVRRKSRSSTRKQGRFSISLSALANKVSKFDDLFEGSDEE